MDGDRVETGTSRAHSQATSFYVWGPFGLSVFLAKNSFKSSGRIPGNLGKLVVYCKSLPGDSKGDERRLVVSLGLITQRL